MDEQQILKQLNLSEEDLKDFVNKWQTFVAGLNPAQAAALQVSLPTAEAAAQSHGVTADELTRFVSSRLASTQATTSLLFFVSSTKK
jgi:hypothetical protein